MAGKRLALLIGNSAYADPDFPALGKPEQDVRDLADLLEDQRIGGFEVHTLPNKPVYEVKLTIQQFFQQKAKDDLLLLYFSGHGRRESGGDFYFICGDSRYDALDSTAVEADFVRKQIDRSASQRKVIVLDCCHSGAFGEKSAASDSTVMKDAFTGDGYGRIILAAAKATETAQEHAPEAEIPHSLFTHFVIDGLRTGAADLDLDGKIGAEELFAYVAHQLRALAAKQTPQMFVSKEHGELIIARNPHWQPPTSRDLLSGWLTNLLDSADPSARLRGVDELVTLIQRKEEHRLAAAYVELQRVSTDDASPRVRRAAQGGIEEIAEESGLIEVGEEPPPTEQRNLSVRPVGKNRKTSVIQRADVQPGDTWTEPATGMEFVWIAPGQFMMGATDDEHQFLRKQKWWNEHFKSELPRHSVTIKQGFWLGKYPVTQAQWEHVMGNNPSRFKGANNPVEQVSWDDCQEFLKTLNQLTPHPLSLEKRGGQAGELIPPLFSKERGPGGEFLFRLPTEAEWEYACRAGTDTIWHF